MIDLSWHDRAVCRGTNTELFYVDEVECYDIIARLRSLCARCPVIEQCREHAITWEPLGFWANMTESERREIKRGLGIKHRSIKLSAHLISVKGDNSETKRDTST